MTCKCRRVALACLMVCVSSGCDCQGAEDSSDGEALWDAGPDADVDVGTPDAPPDGAETETRDIEGGGDADGAEGADSIVEAEAWPDAPTACEWYEMRSAFDDPDPYSGDSWVSDPFYAPGDEPVLRVVSIYEPAPPGTVTVRLRRSYRPAVLVLSSYESVTWDLRRDDGARLDRVFVYGYDPQTVTGADDVPVVNHSPWGDHSGYCYLFCSEYDVRPWIAAIESETGLPLRTFDGQYRASGITLGDICREECRTSVACAGRECGYAADCRLECGTCEPGTACDGATCRSCTPSCLGRECGPDGCGGSCGACAGDRLCDRSGACVVETTFPGCDDLRFESHYCLTRSGNRPALLGLDSGTVCAIGKPDLDLSAVYGSPSIGWLDGALFVCVDRPGLRGLVRYDVLDDVLTLAPAPCEGVATWRGGLVAQQMGAWGIGGITHFASFEDALDGEGEVWPWSERNTRMTVHGDLLYSAWHSTDRIDVQSLPSGDEVRSILLEGYEGWIWGLSVTDDGLLVVTDGRSGGRTMTFAEATGGWIREVAPSTAINGLVCFVGE